MTQPASEARIGPADVMRTLRRDLPRYPLRHYEAFALADRLAHQLLDLYRIDTPPIPLATITRLPAIRLVVDRHMPVLTSGSSTWDNAARAWVIMINGREPARRQRFTVFHEFFHIVVHPAAQHGLLRRLSAIQVEQVADYFAGSVLIPRRLLVAAWSAGIQSPGALADIFEASPQAIAVSLSQLRLIDRDDIAPPTAMSLRGNDMKCRWSRPPALPPADAPGGQP
jgi:Zn-dependent peptidase ImmA (M78 family)